MILQERGYFWWSDEILLDRQLTPNSAVPGEIRIEDDGRAALELDGCLPSKHGPMAAFDKEPLTGRCIQGLLKGDSKYVLLLDLHRRGGGFSSNGISFERFVAFNCLVSESQIDLKLEPLTFTELKIPLTGFEEWLRFGSIDVTSLISEISVIYRRPQDLHYKCDDGAISITFDITNDSSRAWPPHYFSFSLREAPSIRLYFKSEKSITDLALKFNLVRDVLILLTDSDCRVDWPSLSRSGMICRWYFTRLPSETSSTALRWQESCTNFPEIREKFDSIWSAWTNKHEEFGPGFFLYLATRRGLNLYVEHHFVNLIFGIEALHRKKNDWTIPVALSEKIKRILDQVTRTTDKRWLESQLKAEPRLGDRIFDVFSTVPLGLDLEKLRNFSDECAKTRHEIAHFGGARHDVPYSDFQKNVRNKADALSTLYHAKILQEIGIGEEILKRWISKRHGSFRRRESLFRGGLLDSID